MEIAQLEQEEEQKRRLLMEEKESARVAAAELETLSKKVEESVKQMDLPLPVREQRDTYVSGKAQHDYAAPAPLRAQDIPLSILLRNYLYLLARDRRNMVMLLMSVVIIFFCVGLRPEVHQDTDVYRPFLLVENETQCSPVSVVLTTTATEVVTVTIVETIAPAHEAVAAYYSLPVINSSLTAEQHSKSQLDTSAPVQRLSVSTSVVTPVLSEPTTAPEISAGKPGTVNPHVEGVPTEQPAVPDSPLLGGGQSPAPAAPEDDDSVVTQGVTTIDVLGGVSDGPMEMSED